MEKELKTKFEGYDYLTKAQWIELKLFMSGYLLSSQGDRMAMANSVEGRYPFLDHRLIEFAMSLHPDLKLNGLNEKYVLKRIMKGKLPETILNRSKQAYRAPIRSAFNLKQMPEYLKLMLTESQLKEFGIFNPENVNQLLTKMQKNSQVSEIDTMAITAILSTQILYDLFVKGSMPKLTDSDLVNFDKMIIE